MDELPNLLSYWTLSNITDYLGLNCDTGSNYLARFLEIPGLTVAVWDGHLDGIDLSSSYPYTEAINLVRSTFPEAFENVSRAAIVDWIDGLDESLPIPWLRKFLGINFDGYWSEIECHTEVCQRLQWEGNPDLVGIGVSPCYAPILFLVFYCKHGRKQFSNRVWL